MRSSTAKNVRKRRCDGSYGDARPSAVGDGAADKREGCARRKRFIAAEVAPSVSGQRRGGYGCANGVEGKRAPNKPRAVTAWDEDSSPLRRILSVSRHISDWRRQHAAAIIPKNTTCKMRALLPPLPSRSLQVDNAAEPQSRSVHRENGATVVAAGKGEEGDARGRRGR